MSVKLPTTSGMQLKIEDSFSQAGPQLMTGTGDNRTFVCGAASFSLCEQDENGVDRRPVVRPDGLRNGCRIRGASSGISDAVDVSEGSLWIAGAEVAVTASSDITITRPVSGSVKKVSVVANSLGSISLVDGTEGANFSDSRGAAGGPPFVDVGKVEIAILKLSDVSGPISESEISFFPEYSFAPSFDLSPHEGKVIFREDLPLIHTEGVSKNIYITYCEPAVAPVDMFSITPPYSRREFDYSFSRLAQSKIQEGRIQISLSGDQSDLLRRIEGSVRLFEFMPDSAGTRKEIFYAFVENNLSYQPGELMAGEYLLLPVAGPIVEGV